MATGSEASMSVLIALTRSPVTIRSCGNNGAHHECGHRRSKGAAVP